MTYMKTRQNMESSGQASMIRILIADDHKIMREGLRALIDKEIGMEIIGEAKDGQTTVKLARKLTPSIIVMDIGMPELNGIECTRQILSDNPKAKVLALSMHSDRRFVTEMLRAGASGYLLKDAAFEELIRAVRTVASGRSYLSPDIAGSVIENYVRQSSPTPEKISAFSVLTNREREVLQLLAEGNTTKEIAATLFVSVKTVETHRRNIMKKLDLHSVAELTKYAVREGLTMLEK